MRRWMMLAAVLVELLARGGIAAAEPAPSPTFTPWPPEKACEALMSATDSFMENNNRAISYGNLGRPHMKKEPAEMAKMDQTIMMRALKSAPADCIARSSAMMDRRGSIMPERLRETPSRAYATVIVTYENRREHTVSKIQFECAAFDIASRRLDIAKGFLLDVPIEPKGTRSTEVVFETNGERVAVVSCEVIRAE